MAAPRLSISPPLAYIASVIFDKGVSILTIPIVAAYVTPDFYGRLDVAVSLIEFVGLVMCLGMGDTLLRYASTTTNEADRRRTAAEILASAAVIVVVAGLLLQALAPTIAAALAISVSPTALRWSLLGATLTAFIEMPLMWMRLVRSAGLFLGFIAARSMTQLVVTYLVLRAGLGADGLLTANGITMVAFSLLLAGYQVRETGLAFAPEAFRRVARYGLPLVLAWLSMFALGSCSRWFLSGRVADADIAFYGLATKFALAAPLLLQPFALWWNPRRIAVLAHADGLEESRWAWGLGYSVLLLSSLAVCLAAPPFIVLFLPAAYAPAVAYIPFVVLVCFLNELNTLCNTGAFARDSGLSVLHANGTAAMVAIAGYALLTPRFGIAGVIAAVVIGHLVRLALFLWSGRTLAPIAYPAVPAALAFLLAAAAVFFAPDSSTLLARFAWALASGALMVVSLLALGLLTIPDAYLPSALRRSLSGRAL